MKKVIMVVDDEPDIRETVKHLLEDNNYRVITAVDGDDCLDKLEFENPSLILLDIMMPGTPVRTVIKKIRKTKIAFLSVVRMGDLEREKLVQGNIVDFIQKPFEVDDLISKVKKIVD